MRTRLTAVLAMFAALAVVLLPGTASATAAPATEPAVVEPMDKGFDVAVYNGTGRKMYVSSAGHNSTPKPGNTETLHPGEWSDEATSIDDVDQLRVPGCDVYVQLGWYEDGEWAHVHGVTPWVWIVDLNC